MDGDNATGLLLRRAWAALGGGDGEVLDRIELIGDGEGLLPSAHAAMPAMTAAVAASARAAAVLDGTRRSSQPSTLIVDRHHVAAAARSEHYARTAQMQEPERISPLARFWRTADGSWFRLHGEYPWHRDRALGVLACDDRHRSIKQSVSRWKGEDLEDALAAAGGLGYMVRSEAQWHDHPQGRAIAGLPLVELGSGVGPGRPAPPARGATGLRVLDLTRVLAGPLATKTLAAWGAEVLRVDSPHMPEIHGPALDMLPGKRSTQLDLAQPADRVEMEQLLSQADLLVCGYRPGALGRFGLDPDALWDRHPHLCVVTLSAWGASGPWADRRGFDSVVQGPTGIALAEGVNGLPGTLPAQVLDHATGYLAAAAAMLALASVQAGGVPASAQLSLAQTARWLVTAGVSAPEVPRRADIDSFRVVLPGGARPVEVIRPAGRLSDLTPCWTFTTEIGADAPRFDSARHERAG